MRCGPNLTAPYTPDGLSSRTFIAAPLSPELLDPNESLLFPLDPLSDPGPWCLLQFLRTRVGELSLDVVSGALLSMAAIPESELRDVYDVKIYEVYPSYGLPYKTEHHTHVPTECFFTVFRLVQRNFASQAL